ncbi:MAG TPA: MMPL family transporter, partial [Mycobacterium sp.]|nr:MMPL family transporter [Mycobacterium sp.]
TAVRRTVMTAGRTVTFSAVIIIASGASLLVLPQGFVKALTYALIAAVTLAALLSITLLPACLGILGRHVDALGVRTLFRVPFLRNWNVSRVYLNWVADRLQRTKTREEVEAGFWGKLVNRVMKRPLVFALPIVIAMILLVIPLGRLSLGGISERYLPPNNPVRQAQEQFDKLFPGFRNQPLTLVIKSNDHHPVSDQQVAEIRSKAMAISGLIDPDNNPAKMWAERPCLDGATHPCQSNGKPKDPSVRVIENGLVNPNDAAKKISELRAITPPKGLAVLVGGTPALEQDSIHSLFDKAPLMLVLLITTTMLLMFLAFGSLVLPIKAAVMSALTLGSTMGILTWIFVDGHFSKWLNFTPTPLMVVIIALVVAVGFGLATDYEVFLVSRMVEAREHGMSTAEAIRIGTATTGRLITAAALILAVVAGSFVFSDLVIMKYLAFGLMAALLLDATVVRMFLVPSVMKLLGDDCWWAPRWMKRMQTRLGLGEIHLPDERKRLAVRARAERPLVAAHGPVAAAPRPPHDPTHPAVAGPSRPGAASRLESAQATPSGASTTRMSAGAEEPWEQTTRFSAARNPVPNASPTNHRTHEAPVEDREIESWLSELRGKSKQGDPPADVSRSGNAAPPPPPSAGQTRAMPVPTNPSASEGNNAADASTAIPVPRPEDNDIEPATEKLNTRGQDGNSAEKTRSRGGGLSAQDLLRRVGWF